MKKKKTTVHKRSVKRNKKTAKPITRERTVARKKLSGKAVVFRDAKGVLTDNKFSKSIQTFADDKELIAEAVSGSPEAREKLVKNYFPFVASIVKKYKNFFPWMDFNELVEEANFGLLEAIARFESGKNVKFSSYSWFWIVKNIQEYIGKQLAFVKVPQKVLSNLKKIKKLLENGIMEKSFINYEDITKQLDMKIDEIRDLVVNHGKTISPLSLDQYVDDDEQRKTLKDYLASKEKSFEEFSEGEENSTALTDLIDTLNTEEAEVIKWRFGFQDNKYHSLTDISRKLNISPQKVRDIELLALARLKELWSDK